jgi:hypothetical protein
MTILMAAMHVIVHTNSNLIEQGVDVTKFDQQEIDARVFGSKLVLVVEQMQCCTIWLVKACLLLMYFRMTCDKPTLQKKIQSLTYPTVHSSIRKNTSASPLSTQPSVL